MFGFDRRQCAVPYMLKLRDFEHLDIVECVLPHLGSGSIVLRRICSRLSKFEKLSATALSCQFPHRLTSSAFSSVAPPRETVPSRNASSTHKTNCDGFPISGTGKEGISNPWIIQTQTSGSTRNEHSRSDNTHFTVSSHSNNTRYEKLCWQQLETNSFQWRQK